LFFDKLLLATTRNNLPKSMIRPSPGFLSGVWCLSLLTHRWSSRKFFWPEMKKARPKNFDLRAGLVLYGVWWLSLTYEKDIFSTFIVFLWYLFFVTQMLNIVDICNLAGFKMVASILIVNGEEIVSWYNHFFNNISCTKRIISLQKKAAQKSGFLMT